MVNLINHSIITYEVSVSEADVGRALITEAMERHGLTHDGKPIPGMTSAVLFDGRRGGGTYIVKITRDLSKSGQAQLAAPADGSGGKT